MRPRPPSSRSSRTKAEYQSEGGVLSQPVCAESFAAKNASWSCSVMPGFGRSPSNLITRASERRENSSINVDLPMRRRPRHVTSEAVSLDHNPSSCASSESRPKNFSLLFFTPRIIQKPVVEVNPKNSPILHFAI